MPSDANRYLHLVRQDCPLPPGSHVIAYCRDSGGEEQERSVQQQAQAVEEYCQQHKLILERIYTDEARTGSNSEKRSQLQDMLTDIVRRFKQIRSLDKRHQHMQKHPFGVIVWKSNRLGRDSIETTYVKADMRIRGLTIINLVPSVETGDAKIDALFEVVQQYQDEKLLEEISENSRRGLAELVSLRDNDPVFRLHNPDWPTNDGRYLGIMPGTLPRGFKAERITIGMRDRKGRSSEKHIVQRMVPNHDDNMWERCYLAWQMRIEGAGLKEILKATQLYKTVNGYTTFFQNRIYTGDLEYGGKIYEDFVQPLITKDWFNIEAKRREARAAKHQKRQADPNYEPRRIASRHLLSGIVFCGEVENELHPMHGDTIPEREGKRSRWDFYICSHKKNSRDRKCQSPRISAAALDQSVISNLTQHILTHENLRPVADAIAGTLETRNTEVNDRIVALQGRLSEVRKSIDKLVDAIEQVGFSANLHSRLQEREDEERSLIADLANLEDLLVHPIDIPRISDKQLNEWIESTYNALIGEDIALARQAIQQFVAKVVIKQKTVTLFYTFPLSSISRDDVVAQVVLHSNPSPLLMPMRTHSVAS